MKLKNKNGTRKFYLVFVVAIFAVLATLGTAFALSKSHNPIDSDLDGDKTQNAITYDYLPIEVDANDSGKITKYVGEENAILNIPSSYSIDADGKYVAGTDIMFTSVGNSAFKDIKFAYCNFDLTNVKTIEDEAFSGSQNISFSAMPNMQTIGQNAFYNSTSNFQSLNLKNISNFGESAFEGVKQFDAQSAYVKYSKNSSRKVLFADTVVTNGACEIGMDNGVTTIAASAFKSNGTITSIKMGNGIINLGSQAFYQLQNNYTLTFGNGITTVGTYAFQGGSGTNGHSLTSIDFGNGFVDISASGPRPSIGQGNGIFSINTSLTSINFGNAVIKNIGGACFHHTGVTNIVLPQSLTTIGEEAFSSCSGLTSVTFADTTHSWTANGVAIGVSNTSTNATNLKSTYANYPWTKNV